MLIGYDDPSSAVLHMRKSSRRAYEIKRRAPLNYIWTRDAKRVYTQIPVLNYIFAREKDHKVISNINKRPSDHTPLLSVVPRPYRGAA